MEWMAWNGIQWTGWNGVQCNRMECNAMQCNAMQSNGMEWNGMILRFDNENLIVFQSYRVICSVMDDCVCVSQGEISCAIQFELVPLFRQRPLFHT
eukprot:scaffold37799_cov24-Prasinocladus_malaysianus.AAC.1